MLKLEEKDYDLNFLFKFSFDFAMLKEILLKLSKSNKDLESRIKNLEKSNNEKDKRISNLEDKLNMKYISEEKSNLSDEEKEDINNINSTEENYDYTKSNLEQGNYSIKNKQKEKEKEKEEGKLDEKDIINKDIKRKRSRTIKIIRNNYDNINSYVSHQVSPEAIRSLLKLIKENTKRINKLDKNLNRKITNNFNDLQKDLNNLDSKNAREHKIIEGKIQDLYIRLNDCNDKMDGIIVKTAPLIT